MCKANKKIKSILELICKCMREIEKEEEPRLKHNFECKTRRENNSEFNFYD